MALIKCPECKKEISDKARNCIHCGCPIKLKRNINKINSIMVKVWPIICIIICLFISLINFLDTTNITKSLVFNSISLNIMAILSLLLGIAYYYLFKTYSTKSFHLILGLNVIIFIYNAINFNRLANLYYILCVISNILITYLILKKEFKKSEINIKSYLPIIITLIITIIFTLVFSLMDVNKIIDVRSNRKKLDSNQLKIITDYINIRASKDVSSSILGKVYKGEIYNILDKDEDSYYKWYEIKTSNGIKGFIAGKVNDTYYVKEINKKTKKDNTLNLIEVEETTNTTVTTKKITNKSNNSVSNNEVKTTTTTTTKPIDNNSKIKTEETTTVVKTTTKKGTKVIDATVKYTCNEGKYRASNHTCYYETVSSSAKELVCPSGFEPESLYNKRCKRSVSIQEVVDAMEVTTCTSGDEYYVVINGQEFCQSGSLTVKHVCPSGYTLNSMTIGVVTKYACYWNFKNDYTTGYITCNNGYKLDKANNVCYKEIEEAAVINYSCPSGYTLKDTKCYSN